MTRPALRTTPLAMKQFFLTVLGVFTGLILFVVVVPIVLITIAISTASSEEPTPRNTVLELDLRDGVTDQAPSNPFAIFGGSGLSTLQIVDTLAQAEDDGRVKALLIRLQLGTPDNTLLDPQTYNAMFTMHGTTMVFLFVIPIMAGFGNYFAPLQIGARDMAFPKLNGLSFWFYMAGGIVSLGLDTFHTDPISDLAVTTDGFERCGALVRELGLPTVVLQEGGYDVSALGENVRRWLVGLGA